MDSLTHIASGALIGEFIAGKKLGKRALLIGALAQSIPDIDFVASFWLDPADDLLAHRSITHSLLFLVFVSLAAGWLGDKTHPRHALGVLRWTLFFAVEMATHLFLDAFNNYGVGWFEPFSNFRISFNTIFVVDPFYTLPLLIAFVVLLIGPGSNRRRTGWAATGIFISSIYLAYALLHKSAIDNSVKKELERQHISSAKYFTTPAAFNNWLWYAVAKSDSGFYVAYRSVYDRSDTIDFQFFPQHASLLPPGREDLTKLIRFSQGFYTVSKKKDTIAFNDLRFGQIAGWVNPRADFVFHYYVNHPEDNLLVVQRGRFEGWNKKTMRGLAARIKGR